MTTTTSAPIAQPSLVRMLIDSVRSEWTKLGRRNVLFGGIGTILGFALLLTIVGLTSADNTGTETATAGPPGGFGGGDLSAPDGWLAGLEQAASFIGIIALALFAANIAAEFNTGSIRVLLSTQSRRPIVLGGIIVALSLFVVLCVIYAAIASGIASAVLAGSQGVDSDPWWTGDGIVAGLGSVVNVGAAAIVYGLFGALLGLATRSSAIAIAAGIAYFLLGETLVFQAIWDSSGDWLPAGVLSAFATGGSETLSYGRAGVMTLLWGTIALVATVVVFQRRDITD